MGKIELHNEEFTYSTTNIVQTITLFKLEKRFRASMCLQINTYIKN